MDNLSRIAHYLKHKSTLRALRHRDYALVELAGWFSAGGFWFYKIGLGILTWELTESGFWLAVIALSDAIPSVLLAPIAGAVADRYDRLVVGRIVQGSIMVVTAILALLVLFGLANLSVVVVLAITHGAAGAFWMPLRMALAPTLVPKEDLAPAIALHSTLFNIARFLFPALAIPVLAKWGVGIAFMVNAGGYMFYMVVLFMIRIVNPDARADRRVGVLANLRDGVIYAAGHAAVRYFLLMLLFTSVFLMAYIELLPGISETVFGKDPKDGVAVLVSAAGFGAIATSLLVGSITRIESLFRIYFIMVGVGIVMLAVFANTQQFELGMVFMAIMSGAQMGMLISGQVIVQSSVEGAFRGRVMSLWAMTMRGGPAVGALILGSIADLIDDFQLPLVIGATIAGFAAIFVYTRRQEMLAAANRIQPAVDVPSTVEGAATIK